MKSVHLKAYAKINLGLDVIRKREDNYHEVRMIMQTIDLYDKLTLKIIDEDTIILKTNLSFLPTNENNLVYKAVKLLKDEFQIKKGVLIDLEKHIPVAAGLAGGSTDCAAALKGTRCITRSGRSLLHPWRYCTFRRNWRDINSTISNATMSCAYCQAIDACFHKIRI